MKKKEVKVKKVNNCWRKTRCARKKIAKLAKYVFHGHFSFSREKNSACYQIFQFQHTYNNFLQFKYDFGEKSKIEIILFQTPTFRISLFELK